MTVVKASGLLTHLHKHYNVITFIIYKEVMLSVNDRNIIYFVIIRSVCFHLLY